MNRMYQEYRFSASTLIFINGPVYYRCGFGHKCAEWPENKLTSGDRDIVQIDYVEHVRNYTKRGLSCEYDILNAFAAILAEETIQHGSTFFWGLPKENFALALLWQNDSHPSGKHNHKKFIPL